MAVTVIRILLVVTDQFFQSFYEIGTVNMAILFVMKVSPREVK